MNDRASGRLPVWSPFVAVWAVWAFFQLLWGVGLWLGSQPLAYRLVAIPLVLLPFDASLHAPFDVLVTVVTPFIFVFMDVAAHRDWRLRTALMRCALLAVWIGLSWALAPAVGTGVVWTGAASVGTLASYFAIGWTIGFAELTVAAALVAGLRRVLRARPEAPRAQAEQARPADGVGFEQQGSGAVHR
jgi:hypothetical protein